jgi:hypothetical protein
MQAPSITRGRLPSIDIGWTAGMNSVRHPWLLRKDQYRRATNILNRGGIIQTRPGFRMRLALPPGNLQGMKDFRVTKNGRTEDFLVFAVDGNVYAAPFPLVQPRSWELHRLKNLKFSPTVPMVHFCIAEKTLTSSADQTLQVVPSHNILMIQDGESQAGYWDGEFDAHLVEGSPRLETPAGTWMAFSGGRLWVARGNIVIASDLFDPLSFKERTEGEGRGDFSFLRPITGLTAFMGDDRGEVVVVFTEEKSEFIMSGNRDRAKWASQAGMQSVLFPNTGCIAGRSIVFQSGLMWWYSSGGLVASDTAAASNLTSEITYRDAEMAFSKQFLDDNLSGICGIGFENFLLMSVPVGQSLNAETFVLDYSTMSELSSEKVPAWCSSWTGIRPVQWISALVEGKRRAFAASVDYSALSDGSYNHVWEAFTPEREDVFFDLNPDYTLTEYPRPIFCEFETRLIGDGHDLKTFQYADFSLIEIAGTANITADYRGMRGSYKQVLKKKITAPIYLDTSGADLEENVDLGRLRKQTRRIVTENALPNPDEVAGENEYSENIDKAFVLLVRWCGQMALESIRLYAEPWAEKAEGNCEKDETQICVVGEDGRNYVFSETDGFIPVENLFARAAGRVWSATRNFTVTLTCPSGSVTGPMSVTATATRVSSASQVQANTDAQNAAQQAAEGQAAQLRTTYPCYYDAEETATRTCYSELNERVSTIARLSDGRILLGGKFWLDRSTPQGKLSCRDVSGGLLPTFVQGDGFCSNPAGEPTSEEVMVLIPLSGSNVIACGEFSEYDNVARPRLAQILSTGELEPNTVGFGVDTAPTAGCLLPSGSMLIGGNFTTFNATAVTCPLVKCATSGAIPDFGYAPTGLTKIFALVAEAADVVLVVGYNAGNVIVKRLLANGSNDGTFTPYSVTTADPGFASACKRADGKYVVSFTGANAGKHLVLLNSDGTVDGTYAIGTGLSAAARAAVAISNTVVLGGNFTTFDGGAASRVIKLLSTGAKDTAFDYGSGFDDAVFALNLSADNSVLYAGGEFTEYNGDINSFRSFGRINATTGAPLPSNSSISVMGRARSAISQVDADQVALDRANDRIDLEFRCL